MNRSWNNKSTTSPGFVYFQQEIPYQNSNDSSDYLSFGNSPKRTSPNNNRFSPAHYSSPRFKQNYNRYKMKHSHQYNDFNRNRPYNSSHDSFGSFNSFGSYNSFGSHNSFGSNDSFRGRNRHKRKLDNSNYHNTSKGGKRDMSVYLDATCTTDPWMQLEKMEDEKKIAEEENIMDTNENSDDSSSSEEETESVSEEKSSSSAVEEETA